MLAESVSADYRVSQVVRQRVPHQRAIRRKPAGQMYSASGAVRSAVADQQIRDDAVTRRRRMVGRRPAGTAALDHVDYYTS